MTDSLPSECKEKLTKGIFELGLKVSEDQIDQLLLFVALLNKWNKAFNLTAIRDPEEMVVRHLLDSLSLAADLKGDKIIDVGTGPGIPGIPLAIIFPKRQFTLMDSNGKKVRFIHQAKQSLGLLNIIPVQNRVETFDAKSKFDSVVSRAFTSLERMVRLTEHLVKDDGFMQAMKGSYPDEQILKSPWEITEIIKLEVPFLEEQRHLVNIKRNVN